MNSELHRRPARILRRALAICCLAGPLVACAAEPPTPVTLPGPLVDAAWLNTHRDGVVVLDVRDDPDTWTATPRFNKDTRSGQLALVAAGGHIDGALLVDFGRIRVDRMVEGRKISKLLPDADHFQDLMREVGLRQEWPIVITSPGEAEYEIEEAARLYWTLKVYGTEQVALLDGGNAAWLQAGLQVQTDAFSPEAGDWQAGPVRETLLAQIGDVEKAIEAGMQMVDARPLPQYLGLFFKKPSVTAGGHLKGARNLPTDVRFRSQGLAQVFLTPQEYRAVFAAQGIDANAPSVSYCNTGHMAAGSWFIQSEILGNPQVRLYDGSMHEWTTLGRPVVGLGG